MASCSNGDYQTDPKSPANGAVNPVTPLDGSEFNWSGSEPLSMDINGSKWVADDVYFYLDTSGSNVLIASKVNSSVRLMLYLRDVWAGNVYSMEWQNYGRRAEFSDSTYIGEIFTSDRSNSGGLRISRNDTAVIEGKFYFKGISQNSKVVNIRNGYFKINKW
ncbi:hypothetical protein GCM10023093_23140 [Nemorincola caseinilytica]|uniref:Lipoprotein n=2 Tax=Nemorincola caseinilytica TaxID=2054315 RepID=A0ABP8NLE9_9BACT